VRITSYKAVYEKVVEVKTDVAAFQRSLHLLSAASNILLELFFKIRQPQTAPKLARHAAGIPPRRSFHISTQLRQDLQD
jgi:hypothetical protein